ncbi:MAG TPA: PH domain-containing protein [Actinomycetota bacterium]|nr:PH domain-containing protein [Actinomycetota bacterium]
MGFPRRLLAEGEEVVLDLRPHWIALVPPTLVAAVIVAGTTVALLFVPATWPTWVRWAVVGVGLALFVASPLRAFVAWATSHFVVTSDRLIHREGWIARRSMEIPLENINDVRFAQTVFERLIGAGDLTIESAGEHGQQQFTDIRHPEQVQKVIYEVSEENQRRMMAHAAGGFSVAAELAKLNRLRDEGVITDEEFERQKARLLGEGLTQE